MKKEIRQSTLGKIAALSEQSFQQGVNRIQLSLFNHPKWQRARTIGVTISRGREIPTRPIIERAWQEGKQVAVPKCLPTAKTLDFRHLHHFNQLETVYFGLKEPIISQTPAVNKDQLDLVIVPGVAFDPTGYRIGFGGGYYDRFLADYEGDTVALLLSDQLVERIPGELHDIPVQTLITERTTLECLPEQDRKGRLY